MHTVTSETLFEDDGGAELEPLQQPSAPETVLDSSPTPDPTDLSASILQEASDDAGVPLVSSQSDSQSQLDTDDAEHVKTQESALTVVVRRRSSIAGATPGQQSQIDSMAKTLNAQVRVGVRLLSHMQVNAGLTLTCSIMALQVGVLKSMASKSNISNADLKAELPTDNASDASVYSDAGAWHMYA